jgi:hypothetical protein
MFGHSKFPIQTSDRPFLLLRLSSILEDCMSIFSTFIPFRSTKATPPPSQILIFPLRRETRLYVVTTLSQMDDYSVYFDRILLDLDVSKLSVTLDL